GPTVAEVRRFGRYAGWTGFATVARRTRRRRWWRSGFYAAVPGLWGHGRRPERLLHPVRYVPGPSDPTGQRGAPVRVRVRRRAAGQRRALAEPDQCCAVPVLRAAGVGYPRLPAAA